MPPASWWQGKGPAAQLAHLIGKHTLLGQAAREIGVTDQLEPNVRTAVRLELSAFGTNQGLLEADCEWKPFISELEPKGSSPTEMDELDDGIWSVGAVFVNVIRCHSLGLISPQDRASVIVAVDVGGESYLVNHWRPHS